MPKHQFVWTKAEAFLSHLTYQSTAVPLPNRHRAPHNTILEGILMFDETFQEPPDSVDDMH